MRILHALFSFVLLTTTLAFGQDEAARREDRPRDRVNRQFDAGAPGVGDRLPDVVGLDESGRDFRLANLQGHYTVLVFGCLT